MGEFKGKGRATGTEDGDPNVLETTEPSLLSRVAASASGLTQDAFANPKGNELNERAAAALSNTGKGQSSSKTPGQGSWAESSKLIQPSQANGSSTLRSGQSEAHVKQSENEFSDFLNGTDTFVPSEGVDLAQRSYELHFEQFWAASQPGPQPGPQPTFSKLPFTLPAIGTSASFTIVEQERHDGDEVLALLSGPPASDEQFEAQEDEEHYDWGLSQDQIIELRAMTKEMFPDSKPHTGIAAENPLNLVPISDEYDKQEWFEQWEDVLSRYADEVWGGLLPLIKEARNEVEEMRSGASHGEQPKALRRLNAILSHLQRR
jgi:hypothetical protein